MRADELLSSRGVEFRTVEQDRPTRRCKDSAEERGVSEEQIVKSMIVKRSDEYLHCLLPGDRTLDEEEFSGDVQMASGYEVESVTGFEPGTVHPFSSDCKLLVDESLLRREELSFTSGDPETGIIMPRESFMEVLEQRDFEIVDISKSQTDRYEEYAKEHGLMVNDARRVLKSEHTGVFEEMRHHMDAETAVEYYKFLLRAAEGRDVSLDELDMETVQEIVERADSDQRIRALLVDHLEGEKVSFESFDLAEVVDAVLDEESGAVEDVRQGEDGAIDYLVGQVMQRSKGSADPVEAREAIRNRIS
jgi:prolyl-tRNA editing enzyme YbaK/EbsC (Cys-tRNA(Pro) deacylase)